MYFITVILETEHILLDALKFVIMVFWLINKQMKWQQESGIRFIHVKEMQFTIKIIN